MVAGGLASTAGPITGLAHRWEPKRGRDKEVSPPPRPLESGGGGSRLHRRTDHWARAPLSAQARQRQGG